MLDAWRLTSRLVLFAVIFFFSRLAFAGSFNVGSISSSPVGETKKFWPLASYLARQLQAEGIDDGKVVVADGIPEMSFFLKKKQVDLYIDSFFPSLAVSHLSGSKLLLRRWKMGIGEYRSVIFTRNDTKITRLEDLKGKVIAFEEPFASSGYFFPKIVLLQKGFHLVQKRPKNHPIKPDKVTYIFSRGDSNTIFLVLSGVAAAGAIDNQKYDTLAKSLNSFRIIYETLSFPRQIVSVRADLSPAMVTKVKDILLNMPLSAEGEKVLRAFEGTTKFDEIPARTIKLMAELRGYVDEELKTQR